jgi:NAD(P)-dependent dehydrogenase (short-subunit alcohol dehydrogenase family)
MPQLEGKVAIVTGGSRGIGRAIAEALVDAGAKVTIGARTASAVQRAAKELSARPQGGASADAVALGVACDVASYEQCRRLIGDTVSTFGRLDVLVNNAGIGAFASVSDMSAQDWDAVIGTNLNSLFYCAHEAIPHLKRAGDGWIINIGSLAGKNAFAGGAAYNASKFGLIGFSEALMQDVRHDGIRVSYIMPGSVATEFGAGGGGGREWKIWPEDVARIVIDLLSFPQRTLPSRVEVRPSRPPRK